MNNRETVKAFIGGKKNANGAGWRLNIQDGCLYSYGQVIGEHNSDGTITVHTSKKGQYSVTTTKHIGMLFTAACESNNVREA